jgi:hypothetical protein
MNDLFVYENIMLSKYDLQFYNDLSSKDKILFLFDLCLKVEGEQEDEEFEDIESPVFTADTLKLLSSNSKNESYVHVLILDDIIVFSGNLEDSIDYTKKMFFNEGYIFIRKDSLLNEISEHVDILKNFFKHHQIYELLSQSIPISLN